jgi:hypothetical protein
MSAGGFTVTRYSATYDSTEIHPIRVQPETLLASVGGTANSAPSGSVTNPISARVTGGSRTLGLIARKVRLRLPPTGQPTGYLAGGVITIPALNQTFYNACVKGAAITYLEVTCTVLGRTTEYVN